MTKDEAEEESEAEPIEDGGVTASTDKITEDPNSSTSNGELGHDESGTETDEGEVSPDSSDTNRTVDDADTVSDTDELTKRERKLDKREERLLEIKERNREKSVKLADRERIIDEREEELEDLENEVEDRREELDRRETQLDEREAEIERMEESLGATFSTEVGPRIVAALVGGVGILGFLASASGFAWSMVAGGALGLTPINLLVVSISLGFVSVAQIAGARFAYKKMRWRVALGASFVTLVVFPPAGIVGVLLLSLSRSEFD